KKSQWGIEQQIGQHVAAARLNTPIDEEVPCGEVDRHLEAEREPRSEQDDRNDQQENELHESFGLARGTPILDQKSSARHCSRFHWEAGEQASEAERLALTSACLHPGGVPEEKRTA